MIDKAPFVGQEPLIKLLRVVELPIGGNLGGFLPVQHRFVSLRMAKACPNLAVFHDCHLLCSFRLYLLSFRTKHLVSRHEGSLLLPWWRSASFWEVPAFRRWFVKPLMVSR